MKTIYIFLLAFICYPAIGQQHLGIKVNGGLSKIQVIDKDNSLNNSNKFILSGNGGLYYNLKLSDRFVFMSELMLVRINGKESFEMNLTDEEIGKIFRHITYLGIPLIIGINFNEININVGLLTLYSLFSDAETEGSIPLIPVFNWDRKYNKLNIDYIDFGPRLGIEYIITDKFLIEGACYIGLYDIAGDSFHYRMRNQQITIGLKYNIFTLNKKQ